MHRMIGSRNVPLSLLLAVAPAFGLAACGHTVEDAATSAALEQASELDVYAFESRFVPSASSVAYDGQTFRHLLLDDMGKFIEGLTTAIDSGAPPAPGDTLAGLNFYYLFDTTTSAEVDILLRTSPGTLQKTYGDFLSTANLRQKVAGSETAIDHKNWATEFTGWQEGGSTSPEGLIQYWFEQLEDLSVARGAGEIPTDPSGAAIEKVYVTPKGQDLKQLLLKFVVMSVAYHQATDKYLDSATAGKGLLTPNTRDGNKPYTGLEHAWDEGFGYFGAARDYKRHTDQQNAAASGFDSNGDGAIDIKSELNFHASVNAAKRDLGSKPGAATDFSAAAIDAFLRGRALIAGAPVQLDAAQLAELEHQRDIAVASWEKAIGATAVHYINEVLEDMDKFATPAYEFLDHAKHWSELKGFTLGLQFNPRSPLLDAEFAQLHALIGDAPVLPNAAPEAIAAYRAALLEARVLLGAAYGFDAANLGDINGRNGW